MRQGQCKSKANEYVRSPTATNSSPKLPNSSDELHLVAEDGSKFRYDGAGLIKQKKNVVV